MDYEKKYKEALEWARKVIQGKVGFVLDEVLEKFPELKESEDEKIRKGIVKYLEQSQFGEEHYCVDDDIVRDYIAWLEKQGDNKLADKIEPKFHKGDWITNGDYTWKIVEIKPLDYILQSQDGNIADDTISHVDEQFHFFTIQDVKDGDVLCSEQIILLFKKWAYNNDWNHVIAYAGIDATGKLQITDEQWFISSYAHPATKEQRDTLMKEMTDAGYIFDFENKELKKIEEPKNFKNQVRSITDLVKDYIIQKPAWSEEDEKTWKELIEVVKDQLDCVPAPDCRDEEDEKALKQLNRWLTLLKSLKDRVQPKQEWSEEDKKMFGKVLECISFAEDNYLLEKEEVNGVSVKMWLLDHINFRPKQEWSKEDEEMLNQVIEDIVKLAGPHVCYHKDVDWLKSLKDSKVNK